MEVAQVHHVFHVDEDPHAARGNGERFSNLTRQARDEHQARAFEFLWIGETLMQERFRIAGPAILVDRVKGNAFAAGGTQQVIALLSRPTPRNNDDLLRLHFNG
jgi:hypothetical protein